MDMLRGLWRRLVLKFDDVLPPRRLVVVKGDSLPKKMPIRSVILMQESREDWSVGLQCPCGCGRTIELLVFDEANPRWDFKVDAEGHPSVHPSVWLNNGCKSHFWLKKGRIQWCP